MWSQGPYINIYMSHDSRDWPPQEEVKRLVIHVKDRRLETSLGVQYKLPSWGMVSTDINSRGESLLDFIMGTEMHILNRGTEPTFLDSIRLEVTYINICTQGVMNLVIDCSVSSEPLWSDHRKIINFALHQIQIREKWGHNTRQIDWTGYMADLQSQLIKAHQDSIQSKTWKWHCNI